VNPVYFDLETTGLDPFTSRVTLAQYSRGDTITLCMPDRSSRQLQELKHLLENSLVVGHNLKFDLKFLKHHFNIEPVHLFDTWTAEILISGGMKARQKGAATLEAVTRQYTGLQMQKDATLRQSFRDRKLTNEQIRYVAMDVAVLPAIYERQLLQLEELELMEVFETEMACIPATVWLELSGIPVDREGLKTLALEIRQKMEEVQFRVLTILKESGYRHLDLSGLPAVNLNSPVPLLRAL
jgi:DNA polymerase-1